jgi:tripartite-type tricarboxylate transporter receptor subunit TctC
MNNFYDRRDWLRNASAAALAMSTIPKAFGQVYPNKPVKVLVGAAPGGPSDFLARAFADAAAASLGQSFVVDNKPGAIGTLAAGIAARSGGDGYTLMSGAPTAMVNAPHLLAKLDYDPEKDFVPVAMLGAGAFTLSVHPSLPINTISELVALAKSKPNLLNYASGGNGSAGHFCMEAFAAHVGIELTHVPYRGDQPAAVDLLAGQVQLMFSAPNVSKPHIQTGKLKVIAVSSRERMVSLPNVPSVHESAPGFENYGWIMLFAPSTTPLPVLDALSKIWAQAKIQAALKSKLDEFGMFPPAQYNARESLHVFLKAERDRTRVLVKKLGITPI